MTHTPDKATHQRATVGAIHRRVTLPYGLIHALIDAACVTVIFSSILIHHLDAKDSFYLVVAYDVLAFAGQVFCGLIADRFRFARGSILVGIASTALAVGALRVEPLIAMVLAGAGNAFFHVGAGALTLHVAPGRATPPGLFVAPGALGLAAGLYLGKQGYTLVWFFWGALGVAFVYSYFVRNPEIPFIKRPKLLDVPKPSLAVLLLLVSVAVRSFVGMAGSHACPKEVWVGFGLAGAAFLGKGLGGIISDRWGWVETSVAALLISAPLIAFGGPRVPVIVTGMFFFQMTMPVTLVAIAALLPGRTAFAFGLACLGLIMGALPTFFHVTRPLFSSTVFLGLILLSAASIFSALHLMRREVPKGVLGFGQKLPEEERG